MRPVFLIIILVVSVILSPSLAFADWIHNDTGYWSEDSWYQINDSWDAACNKYYPEISAPCNVVLAHDGLRISMEGGQIGTLSCATTDIEMRPEISQIFVNYDIFPEDSNHHLYVNGQLTERNTSTVVSSENVTVDLCLEKNESDQKINIIWFSEISILLHPNPVKLFGYDKLILTLEKPINKTYYWDSKKHGAIAKIPLSGYFINNGDPVWGATISFFDKGSELSVKTRTDSNGYFSTHFHSTATESSHEIIATWSGGKIPVSSATKSFDIILSSPSPSYTPPSPSPPPPPMQPTQSDDWTGPIVGIILALIVIGIIILVAKNRKPKSAKANIRKKSNRKSPTPRPSSATESFHYACPNCSAKLQPPTSFDAGQKCLSCGWDSHQI